MCPIEETIMIKDEVNGYIVISASAFIPGKHERATGNEKPKTAPAPKH